MPWQSHGFGLALQAAFPILGCPESRPTRELPVVSIKLSDRDLVRRALPAESPAIARSVDQSGEWRDDVVAHPRAGYLLDERAAGLFHVSVDGAQIRCAPGRVARWRWQRHLAGRVLPFASTLNGFEPLHASGVALDGHAIAIVGDSGAGKSTIAAELVLRGSRLLADDVVAVRVEAGRVIAYPGLGLMSLRRDAVQRIGASALRR